MERRPRQLAATLTVWDMLTQFVWPAGEGPDAPFPVKGNGKAPNSAVLCAKLRCLQVSGLRPKGELGWQSHWCGH